MRVIINKESRITAKVANSGGFLTPSAPIVIKNQIREYQLNSIQDLPDVDEVNIVDGATVVYNSTTGLYEIKQITADDISGPIDGGEF